MKYHRPVNLFSNLDNANNVTPTHTNFVPQNILISSSRHIHVIAGHIVVISGHTAVIYGHIDIIHGHTDIFIS